MTILGKRPQTDADYPLNALRGIQTAELFLSGNDVEFSLIGAVGFLFQTLEEMKCKTSFLPDPHADFGDDSTDYRQGVWESIDKVLIKHLRFQEMVLADTSEQRAEWFQGVLRLVEKHFELKDLIDGFRQNLERINLGLSVGDASEAVSLILHPELTGKIAYGLAQDVIADLEVEMTEYVKCHTPTRVYS